MGFLTSKMVNLGNRMVNLGTFGEDRGQVRVPKLLTISIIGKMVNFGNVVKSLDIHILTILTTKILTLYLCRRKVIKIGSTFIFGDINHPFDVFYWRWVISLPTV